ncbi:hypothetical protein BC829DRAFT_69082 [Chytridium lagenaria]|nr:hypothetical protein BC829DRAFT_69082 [Chytridium lagenaria]
MMLLLNNSIALLLISLIATTASAQDSSPTVRAFHLARVCPRPLKPAAAPPATWMLLEVSSLPSALVQVNPQHALATVILKSEKSKSHACVLPQQVFNDQFLLDHGSTIRTDGSVDSKRFNLERAIITLQNSFCCPASAVTFNDQLTALANGGQAPAPPPPNNNNNKPSSPPPRQQQQQQQQQKSPSSEFSPTVIAFTLWPHLSRPSKPATAAPRDRAAALGLHPFPRCRTRSQPSLHRRPQQ